MRKYDEKQQKKQQSMCTLMRTCTRTSEDACICTG